MSLISHARRARRGRVPAMLAAAACAATLATAATPVAAAAAGEQADRAASRAWSPFFDELRAVDAVDTRRVVVTFDDPSLGEWVAASRTGELADAARRTWLRRARMLQQRRLDALATAGVQFRVEHRYLRVLNGASIVVHGDGAQLLRGMSGVATVTPVRTTWPTAVSVSGAAGAAGAAGADGAAGAAAAAGADRQPDRPVRVAVLDAGIEEDHPAVAGRLAPAHDATVSSERRAGDRAKAAAAGTTVDADPHGTAVAGAVIAGAGRDAAGVQLLPVQVLTTRPGRDGTEALLGDSDDLLAGLEHAVDPNGDGVAADGADVAVVASSVPYAGFANSPEDRAVRAADALGTLVVAAAGNDGASGDAVGTIGSVAASRAALAVGAADLRGTVRAADVRVRGGGVDDTFAGAPLLTAGDAPLPEGRLAVVVVDSAADEVVDYLDEQLRSRVVGAVALVASRDGVPVAAQVRAAADAGALAVLVGVDGAVGAAATLDVPGADIPAIAIERGDARDLRDVLADGERVAVELATTTQRNPAFGTVAGFSSGGPRLDGHGRPDVLGPGVGMLVAADDAGWRHASGTSIAAAWVAGQVAAVRSAHPDWTPAQVRAAATVTAIALGSGGDRPRVARQGAGVVSVSAARDTGWFVEGGRIEFGPVAPGDSATRAFELRSTGAAPIPASPRILLDDGGSSTGVVPILSGQSLVLEVADDADEGHVGGWLVLPDQGIRVPWSATVRDRSAGTVPLRATLSSRTLRPVAGPGAFAGSLSVAIGGGSGAAEALGVAAVERLEVRLLDADGKDRGVLGGLHQALPGIYTFGITGVDRAGKRLEAGSWQLRVRYVPASDPDGAWRAGPTTTFSVARPVKR